MSGRTSLSFLPAYPAVGSPGPPPPPPAAEFHGVRLYKTASQSINHDYATNVTWQAEDADTDDYHAGSSAQVVIPPGLAGYYIICASLAWQGSTSGRMRSMDLLVNGLAVAGSSNVSATSQDVGTSAAAVVWLDVGDVLTVSAYHTTGAALNVEYWAEETHFDCYLIGASASALRLYKTGTQAIPTGTRTPITFDTPIFDTSNFHSGSSADVVIPTGSAGWYFVAGSLIWTNLASTRLRTAFLTVNGAAVSCGSSVMPNVGDNAVCSVSAVVWLDAADVVRLEGYHNIGGDYDTDTWNQDTQLSLVRLGDATLHGVRLYKTADQTIDPSEIADLAFEAEDGDDDDGYHNGTHPEWAVIPAGLAGWYALSASVPWAGTTGQGKQSLSICRNGSNLDAFCCFARSSSDPAQGATEAIAYLNEGDIITARVYNTNAVAVAVTHAEQQAHLALVLLTTAGGGAPGTGNNYAMLQAIRSLMPDIVGFCIWNGSSGIDQQPGAVDLMTDPWVVTRADYAARGLVGTTLDDRTVTWESDNPTIADPTTPGYASTVQYAAPGATAARAICETVPSQDVPVTVAGGQTVATIAATPTDPIGDVGGFVDLTAVLKDAGGNVITGRPVVWSTDHPEVASPDPGHSSDNPVRVHFRASGTCHLQAWNGSVASNVVTVIVSGALVPVAQVIFAPPALSGYAGASYPVTVTVKDADGNVLVGRRVTFTTSDATVVDAPAEGLSEA